MNVWYLNIWSVVFSSTVLYLQCIKSSFKDDIYEHFRAHLFALQPPATCSNYPPSPPPLLFLGGVESGVEGWRLFKFPACPMRIWAVCLLNLCLENVTFDLCAALSHPVAYIQCGEAVQRKCLQLPQPVPLSVHHCCPPCSPLLPPPSPPSSKTSALLRPHLGPILSKQSMTVLNTIHLKFTQPNNPQCHYFLTQKIKSLSKVDHTSHTRRKVSQVSKQTNNKKNNVLPDIQKLYLIAFIQVKIHDGHINVILIRW